MKQYFLIINVPDCFEANTNRVEVNIKGMPEGKYIPAEFGEFNLSDDKKEEA